MFTLLMELGREAGKAIKAGVVEYNRAKGDCSQGHLAALILKETAAWKPEVKGKSILTPPLRASLANALAGLAYNIGAAESGRPVV